MEKEKSVIDIKNYRDPNSSMFRKIKSLTENYDPHLSSEIFIPLFFCPEFLHFAKRHSDILSPNIVPIIPSPFNFVG